VSCCRILRFRTADVLGRFFAGGYKWQYILIAAFFSLFYVVVGRKNNRSFKLWKSDLVRNRNKGEVAINFYCYTNKTVEVLIIVWDSLSSAVPDIV